MASGREAEPRLPPIDAGRATEALCFSSDEHERLSLWAEGFGADAARRSGPSYEELCAAEDDSRSIDKDVPRTLPDHALFRDGNGAGCARLRQLLCALRAHPKGGYCQGLNYVAALVLIAYGTADTGEGALWPIQSGHETQPLPL